MLSYIMYEKYRSSKVKVKNTLTKNSLKINYCGAIVKLKCAQYNK